MNTIETIVDLFQSRGDSQYGQEAVTQAEHALQTALLAEQAGADDALIAAALLHDVGHLLHALPDDAPDQGIDDHHETAGYRWLEKHFGPEVTEPVRLHVAAKRYLCAVEPSYVAELSPPSVASLAIQGGPMTDAEVQAFESLPQSSRAVRLRRWDDAAKVVALPTPDLKHFCEYLKATAVA